MADLRAPHGDKEKLSTSLWPHRSRGGGRRALHVCPCSSSWAPASKGHPWSQTMWSTWSALREAELRSKRHRPLSRALSLGGVTWGRGGHRARARHRAGVKLLRAPRHSCFWDREKLAAEAVRGGDIYQCPNSFTTIPIVWASTEMGIFSQSCGEEKPQDMVTNQSPKIQKPKLRHMVWKPDEIFEIGDVPPKIHATWFSSSETNRMLNCSLFIYLFWSLSMKDVGVYS